MTLPDDLKRLVEEALATQDWYKAAGVLRGDKPAEELRPEVVALIDALMYGLTQATESRRDQWGEFVPFYTDATSAYPAPVEFVSDERLQEWASLFDDLDHPLVHSRLGDLLWIRRFGPTPHRYCRAALRGYLALGKAPERRALDRAYSLMRAAELAVALNDKILIDTAISELTDAASRALRSADEPRVTLRLLAAMARLPNKWQPEALDALLQRAQELFTNDPHALEAVITLQIARAQREPERQRQLAEILVDRWEREANAAAGMLKPHHLERALQLATNHGLTEHAIRLRLALQEIGEEDLGLQAISTTVSVPTADVDAYITAYVRDGDWRASLIRFGAHCPVGLDRAKAEMEVRQLRQETPFAAMLSRKVFGPGGVHIKTVATDEDRLAYDMTRQECLSITFWSTLAVPILQRIFALDPPPTAELLEEFFTTDIIPAPVAKHVARAFEHYQAGDYNASLFVLIPRVEAIVRELARRLGLVIIREPRGPNPGGYRPLGDLLWTLRGVLEPEGVVIYLWTLLADPVGVNLRNDALHGLVEDATQQQAALGLHAVSLLRLFKLTAVE